MTMLAKTMPSMCVWLHLLLSSRFIFKYELFILLWNASGVTLRHSYVLLMCCRLNVTWKIVPQHFDVNRFCVAEEGVGVAIGCGVWRRLSKAT